VSIHKHVGPRLGHVRLQSVDRLQIRALYRKLVESGLSETTVHNVHICLHKALQDAHGPEPALSRVLPFPAGSFSVLLYSVSPAVVSSCVPSHVLLVPRMRDTSVTSHFGQNPSPLARVH
jgi:hypothetical protein